MAVMSALVKGVATGRLPGTVISGPHGIGKSYVTFKILETYESLTVHPYKGQTTPLSLYNNLLSASEPGNIVVFDDNDSVFNDQVSLNILKAVLDPTSNREVAWASTSGKVDVPRFRFNGGIIILTNQNLKSNPHFAAFIDRLHCYQMQMSLHELLAKVQSIAESYEDQAVAKQVLLFMVKNIETLKRRISLRTFHRIAELVDIDPDNWEDIALHTILNER